MRSECQIIKTSHSFLTVLLISHKLPVIAHSPITQKFLPDRSPITPHSSESVLSNFFLASEAVNLYLNSNIAFTDHFPSSVNKPSKLLITEYPSGRPCSPNTPNFLPPMWSPYIPPHPHTTSQRKNGTNYHYNLDILSTDNPSDTHHGNPPQVLIP